MSTTTFIATIFAMVVWGMVTTILVGLAAEESRRPFWERFWEVCGTGFLLLMGPALVYSTLSLLQY
jgi:hypothetical protein